MQLLYTITTYPPSIGGAQLHQHLLAQHMVKLGQSVKVVSYWDRNRTDWLRGITIAANNYPQDYTFEGIPIYLLGFSAWEKLQMVPWIPIYYPLMALAVEQLSIVSEPQLSVFIEAADLVHNVRIGREVLSYTSLKLARKKGIPFVLTPVHHPRWSGWRYKVYEQIYREADAVIALTEAERNILLKIGVKPERTFVTGIGPVLAPSWNSDGFRTRLAISGFMVLFLGQHYSYKGYQQLLKASSIIWKTISEVHFVFIGPLVQNSKFVFKAYQDRRIHCLGSVPLQVKTDALAACDLLCVPSTQESFGGVYVEAWSFQKPVIACKVPAVSNVVTDQIDGLLVEQTPDDIASAIISLLANSQYREKLGKLGKEKVDRNYTWDSLSAKTLNIYQLVQ